MQNNRQDLLDLLLVIFPETPPPKPLGIAWAAARVLFGQSHANDAASLARTTPRRVNEAIGSGNVLEHVLGGPIPYIDSDIEARARQSLGQLIIGNLAERAFEEIYRDMIGTSELELKDDRGSRGETDYLVFNGRGRQVFRINIKFHGSQFRKAVDLVGLDPTDCFALATYKIHAALKRQEQEHLPYIFVIVGVSGLTGAVVGEVVPPLLIELASLPRMLKAPGVRSIEDGIVDAVTENANAFGIKQQLDGFFVDVREANWYVLSARRANNLLREKLFERVYALRVRSFARNYGRAEVDMHFSLRDDLIPLTDFLSVLRDDGMPGLTTRLERGTF